MMCRIRDTGNLVLHFSHGIKAMKSRDSMLFIALLLLMQAPVASAGGRKDREQPPADVPVQVEPSAPLAVPEPEKPRGRRASKLTGRITEEDGSPLQGVEVSCIDEEQRVVARTVTDQEGRYLFKNLSEGKYTIRVDYSGFASKRIELEDGKGPPPAPAGLVLYEITDETYHTSLVRAQWNRVRDAQYYRCELYLDEGEDLIQKYPDMKQNMCEFGGLEPGAVYRIRVYAKNEKGYSSDFTERTIRTQSRKLEPPFGLGVTLARNNVVELVWDRIESDELSGFYLQIRKEDGPYRYYSRDGLKASREEAYLIEDKSGGPMTFRIDDVLKGDTPLIENTVAYAFRVFSVDRSGNRSDASNPVTGIILEDTVSPQPPTNVQHEFIGSELLRVTWESRDRDVVKYRLYYGTHRDRWDGVITTGNNHYDLKINREAIENGEIYIDIVAIDRAGNESGFQTVQRSTTLEGGDEKTEDIVFSSEYRFRDSSMVLEYVPSGLRMSQKPTPVKEQVKPKRYGYSTLRRNKFVVGRGETATLSGELSIPANVYIQVKSGGALVIKDAQLLPGEDSWGGIRYFEGASGTVQNVELIGAATGIEIRGSKRSVALSRVTVRGCREFGIHIRGSTLELDRITLRENGTGLYAEDSRVTLRQGLLEGNTRGMLVRNHRVTVENSEFRNNGSGGGYGLRLYGGGIIRSSRFTGNYVGIVIEKGIGNVLITDCKIQVSGVDGIVIASSSVEVRRNAILGNGRNGIYIRENANPLIAENDIYNNSGFAVTGGGQIRNCYIAFNNGSIYIDDTEERGLEDNLFTSSSTGVVKQIVNVDYIGVLSFAPVVQ
jgi:parallel beta-helix repeat protein